jgi:dihydrofolate reductase
VREIGTIGAIAAASHDGVIGVNGRLPWHYGEDLKRFKRLTMGTTVVMGRRTWESIGARALPGRRNIVISRTDQAGAEFFRSIEDALGTCRGDVWFVGGAQLYAAAMPWCDLLDITVVPDRVDEAGAVRFPTIDAAVWELAEERPLEADPRLLTRRYRRREYA